MNRDWLHVATPPKRSPHESIIAKWRNQVVTLLIERTYQRVEIHRALYGKSNPRLEAQVDVTLTHLVQTGAIERPRKGFYSLPCPHSSAMGNPVEKTPLGTLEVDRG